MEKTFFIIKPDGVQRGLVGEVLHRIEVRGFKLEALDMRMVAPELLSQHYEALVDRPFFPKIVDYMTSGPVIIGVFSGNEAIASWRKMMGATNPLEASPGTIRGDFAQAPSENGATFNIVHGSDSKESAQREMLLWFGKEV